MDIIAKVAELADALGLEPSTARYGGSTPPFRITFFTRRIPWL